jgi:hypothetical protein
MIPVVIAAVAPELTVVHAITLVFIFSPVAMVPAKSFIFIPPPFPASVPVFSGIAIIIVVNISAAGYDNLSLYGKMGRGIYRTVLRL